MKKDIRKALKEGRLYFDGGFGTMCEALGVGGTPPELLNLSSPAAVRSIHGAYLAAGSRILTANTFGVNRDKYENYGELIRTAISLAKEAAAGYPDAYIAYDMGPTGRLLSPLGDLPFEEAVSLFSANARAAEEAGADLILIETMNDAYETKAAVVGTKEGCSLPIFVTNAYDRSGRLMSGADPLAMITLLEGLSVDAVGMNCSFGPDLMLSLLPQFRDHCSLPIIVSPNAGLPTVKDGKTVYTVDPEEFSLLMKRIAEGGATVLGGCCGTTPEYIRKTVEKTKDLPYSLPKKKKSTRISSYTHALSVGERPLLIGERINPTGKPRLKEALRREDLAYVVREGLCEEEMGADILDVNVGLPGLCEEDMLCRAVSALQAATALPLQLDSADPRALAAAMRLYNGKPLVNSVNGKRESLDGVLPAVKKYGGVVIALTMDEGGIPESAEGRVAIAERIVAYARRYGLRKQDFVIDPLCLSVSSDEGSAAVTLKALRLLKKKGFYTSLGVSNVSFGLPARDKINAAFFTLALEAGLDAAIMNPHSAAMKDAYYAFCALRGRDSAFARYIAYATEETGARAEAAAPTRTADTPPSLSEAVEKGLCETADAAARRRLAEGASPLSLIGEELIPALSAVGRRFEEKTLYLPQLLKSAEAAGAAFAVIKECIPPRKGEEKRDMILATVQGDIHDIGKNIVRVMLESYGFTVHDLGRDVPPERVTEAVERTGCRLVGLSALMTTTVPAMEETIKRLHQMSPPATVYVGGAVLTASYAEEIGADGYGKDAMETVRLAQGYYGENQ